LGKAEDQFCANAGISLLKLSSDDILSWWSLEVGDSKDHVATFSTSQNILLYSSKLKLDLAALDLGEVASHGLIALKSIGRGREFDMFIRKGHVNCCSCKVKASDIDENSWPSTR